MNLFAYKRKVFFFKSFKTIVQKIIFNYLLYFKNPYYIIHSFYNFYFTPTPSRNKMRSQIKIPLGLITLPCTRENTDNKSPSVHIDTPSHVKCPQLTQVFYFNVSSCVLTMHILDKGQLMVQRTSQKQFASHFFETPTVLQ